ncbi:hypothetical protein FZ103_08865 [Streptomonospora sp. PA3]|uniref:hypothetical protein n=1 Tax=Streptomonospora sp. PA3 TaxID=2607326 RepID=UPI0012DF4C49|nr:hypothetical protein [Streptomonospora sp. PA3]MUL41287.1 hypothetical protein [Streptomonospora sp. PA3]
MGARGNAGTGEGTVTVGVVADPVAAPAQVSEQLARDLPDLLAEHVDADRRWRADVRREQLPPSDEAHTAMMDVADARMRRHGWDFAVCVTDVVLRTAGHPIVADANRSRRIVVVSLPAFGGMALRRSVRAVVAQLIADMVNPAARVQLPGRPARGRRLPVLARRFQRVAPEQPGIDTRILASRGRLRLLVGMVRDNRPWRLVFGLTGPLVGAFAFSAFYTINTTVWRLATTMGALRLLAAVLGSMAVMVLWLIVYHGLWEPSRGRPPGERDQAALFNASTLLTLGIGVGCMFGGLYGVNLAAASVLLAPEVLGRHVEAGVDAGDYLAVALLVTAAGTVAGAIGSGFETEDSVREAAFSYRERARREVLHASWERRSGEKGAGESCGAAEPPEEG